MNFILDNWLSLLALGIALTGGIPGVVSVIDYRKNRPIFRFSLINTITGQASDSKMVQRTTFLFLTGTISNKGNKPLTPGHFELRVKIDGKWVPFQKELIPKDIKFQSELQEIDIKEHRKKEYLQQYSGSVSTAQPVYGHLFFTNNEIDLNSLRNRESLTMELTCVDVFDRQHTVKLTQKLGPTGPGLMYPKHGLRIQPKT